MRIAKFFIFGQKKNLTLNCYIIYFFLFDFDDGDFIDASWGISCVGVL